jgi:hypothetical protein
MSVSVHGTNGVTFNDGSVQKTSALTGFRNRIINGDMRINQRNVTSGTSLSNGGYCLDRWNTQLTASKYNTQQSSTAPTGFTNSLLVTSTSSYSVGSGDFFAVIQAVEGYNVTDLGYNTASAQSIVISFWVQSSLTGSFGASLTTGYGSYPFNYTISSANTWTKISVTIPPNTSYALGSTTNGVGLYLIFSLGCGATYCGTANSWQSGFFYQPTGSVSLVGTNGATFYITGVQLEAGSTATDFERRPYGTELALCQRYYYEHARGSTKPIFSGFNAGTTRSYGSVYFPVNMRANPVLVSTTGTDYYETYQGSTIKSTTLVQDVVSTRGSSLYSDTTGLTAGSGNFFYTIATGALVAFNSEL